MKDYKKNTLIVMAGHTVCGIVAFGLFVVACGLIFNLM